MPVVQWRLFTTLDPGLFSRRRFIVVPAINPKMKREMKTPPALQPKTESDASFSARPWPFWWQRRWGLRAVSVLLDVQLYGVLT